MLDENFRTSWMVNSLFKFKYFSLKIFSNQNRSKLCNRINSHIISVVIGRLPYFQESLMVIDS